MPVVSVGFSAPYRAAAETRLVTAWCMYITKPKSKIEKTIEQYNPRVSAASMIAVPARRFRFVSGSYAALWRTPGTQVWKLDVALAIQGDLVGVGLELDIGDGGRHGAGCTGREFNSELHAPGRKPCDNRGRRGGVGARVAVNGHVPDSGQKVTIGRGGGGMVGLFGSIPGARADGVLQLGVLEERKPERPGTKEHRYQEEKAQGELYRDAASLLRESDGPTHLNSRMW